MYKYIKIENHETQTQTHTQFFPDRATKDLVAFSCISQIWLFKNKSNLILPDGIAGTYAVPSAIPRIQSLSKRIVICSQIE